MKLARIDGQPLMVCRPRDVTRALIVAAEAKEAHAAGDMDKLEALRQEKLEYDPIGFLAVDDEDGDKRVAIDEKGEVVDEVREGDSLLRRGVDDAGPRPPAIVRKQPTKTDGQKAKDRAKAKAARKARKRNH